MQCTPLVPKKSKKQWKMKNDKTFFPLVCPTYVDSSILIVIQWYVFLEISNKPKILQHFFNISLTIPTNKVFIGQEFFNYREDASLSLSLFLSLVWKILDILEKYMFASNDFILYDWMLELWNKTTTHLTLVNLFQLYLEKSIFICRNHLSLSLCI